MSPQTSWIHGHTCQRQSLSWSKSYPERWIRPTLPTSPNCPWSITSLLLIDYPNHTLYRSAWQATSWLVKKLLQTHPNYADVDQYSSCWYWCRSKPLPHCSRYLFQTCPIDISVGCRNRIPGELITIAITAVEAIAAMVAIAAITAITAIAAIAAIAAIVGLFVVECQISSTGAIFALMNPCPEFVGCLDPRCIRNTSRTLLPRLYGGSQFHCYRRDVVKNGVWIVVAPGLITCCVKPVKTTDWLSLSLR